MLSVTVNVSGDAQLLAKLNKLGSELTNWKDALTTTGKGLKNYFGGQAFASQGGVFGTPWAKLSASTQAFKIAHYVQYAAVPLMRTGTMKDSFTYQASSTLLEVTNTADYFKYHQSTDPRHKIPRRAMMGINTDVREIIRRAFHDDMQKKIRAL